MKTIDAWLDVTDDPAQHEIEFVIDVLETEQRADDLLISTSGNIAALGLALVAVGFTMGAPQLAVFTLVPVAVSVGLVLWCMITTQKRRELFVRLYRLRHRPPQRRSWRFWRW